MGKISEAEMEVMKLFWKEEKSLTPIQVHTLLSEKKDWKYSTIKTFLARLVKKRMLSCKKGRINIYTLAMTEEEYKKRETKEFLDTIHHGSLHSMLASLCKQDISDQKLTNLLQELEEKEN